MRRLELGNNKANEIESETTLARGHSAHGRTEVELQSGLRVRLGLRAGDWRCTSCSGKTMGSDLFKPHCEYCEKY